MNNNNENNNNSNGNENETNEDKTSNVFYFKLKTTLMMILFNISSCMIQLLNRNNFNLKQYFFNKYLSNENDIQLSNWPILYLNSIKFAGDFLKDIIFDLQKYKLLYNKSLILSSSINVTFSNCFYNIIEPDYPLNELVDLIIFILNDFCSLSPQYKDLIELILKNHPYINNNKEVLTEIYQLTRRIDKEMVKYSKEFDDEDNFIDDFNELKSNIIEVYKPYNNQFKS